MLLTLAVMLMQAAWILVVPPLRGSDEFDHVYRAAAVARGQWVADEPVQDGRGILVAVPPDIANAARLQCERLSYVGPDNCRPAGTTAGGLVLVGSGAGSYFPVFYAVVGTVARPFEVAAALSVLRAATALLCALLVLGAAWSATRIGRGWPVLALAVSVSPMLVYSTAIVAPNGVEMCAALAVWCALLALGRADDPRDQRNLVLIVAAAAVPLVSLRLLGIPFLVAIVLTVLALDGRRLVRAVRGHRVVAVAGAGMVLCAAGVFRWWLAGPARVEGIDNGPTSETLDWVAAAVRWPMQTIGAFPFQDQPAPAVTYAVYGGAAIGLLVVAVRLSRRRVQWVLLGSFVLALALPFGATVATMDGRGAIWQGRYGLPYSVGFVLIAGALVASAGSAQVLRGWLSWVIGLVLALASVAAWLRVRAEELSVVDVAAYSETVVPPIVLLALLALAASIAITAAVASSAGVERDV